MQKDYVINSESLSSMHCQLSQAELLFILRALNLPDLPGIGERPWGEVELEEAKQQFRTAGLALKARGWIWLDENSGQPSVEPSLQAIVSTCAYPNQMMALIYNIIPSAPVEAYYYHRGELTVRHTWTEVLMHDFQSTNDSDMGKAMLTALFENYFWTFESPISEIPFDVYEQVTKLTFIDPEKARRYLMGAGVAPDICALFINGVHDHKVQIQAQWVYQFTPRILQNSLVFFIGPSSCWLVEKVFDRKIMRIKAVNSDSLHQLFQAAFGGF